MPSTPGERLRAALDAESSSDRLQAALDAGTRPDARLVETLIDQCAIEPDFAVREMLTWALVRHPAAYTVPLLLQEIAGGELQATTQALHTLTKIGDPRGWVAITPEVLHADDDLLARTAWRAAAVLAPSADREALARDLATELGTGGRDRQYSLSRAFVTLGDAGRMALTAARGSDTAAVREHALATELMLDDAERGFDEALLEARALVASTGE